MLPSELTWVKDATIRTTRQAHVTNMLGGGVLTRAFGERSKRVYDLDLSFLRSTTDHARRWQRFVDHVQGRLYPWWLTEPFVDYHQQVYVGVGDASKKSFPFPFRSTSSDRTVWVSGALETAYTLYTSCNLLTDLQANANAGTTPLTLEGVVAGTTVDFEGGVAADGLGCYEVTPSGTASGHGLQTVAADSPAVTVGVYYRASAYVRGSSSHSYRVLINWLDAGGATLSTTTGGTTAGSTGEWVQLTTASAAAPGSSVKAQVVVERTSSAATKYHVGCLQLAPGDLPDWYLPSTSPELLVFTAAPGASAVIRGSAYAYRMTKVRFSDDRPGWTLSAPGYSVPLSITAAEDWS